MLKTFKTHRLVKSEDLNHHGTLFAGRCAEWFVEAGFIAASSLINPKNIVCFKIHGFVLKAPVKAGQTICYESQTVHAGKTSLVTSVKLINISTKSEIISDGFITFVNVDENSQPAPHNIELIFETEEEIKLHNLAMRLKRQ